MIGLSGMALLLYLPYALKAGWYYDDWSLYSSFQHGGSSWGAQFSTCTASIPGGRKLTCLYHVTEFHLFGGDRLAYHLTAILFLIGMAGLAYVILRRCHLSWEWAALTAALLIIFPASDSTRLWPTGAIGQYVMVLELLGVLLVLSGLGQPRRSYRLLFHLGGSALFVSAMFTYEIVVPLVALNGIVYWAAMRNKAALRRGTLDLLLAASFVFYRLVVEPVDPESGFAVHRTVSEEMHRAWVLVSSAWGTWSEVFFTGRTIGAVMVIGVLTATALLWLKEPAMRRNLLPWLALIAGCLLLAGAATFVFFSANDLYVPQVSSAFNRVTLPAAIPYVGIFIGFVGLLYELVRRLVPLRHVAAVATSLLLLGSAVHQLRISTDHKRAWEASWKEQEIALDGYARSVRGLPNGSRIIGTGAPIWEPGYVPIFAATWDLGSAISYTTSFQPSQATPLMSTMTCGRRGVTQDQILLMPYRIPEQPLYFINSTRGSASLVRSQIDCRHAIARFGRPPLFAPTLRN